MSTTLVYYIPQKNNHLCDRLKQILTSKYQLQNGRQKLDEHDLSYLRGLNDAGVCDAERLVELIEKLGSVEINLEY